MVNDKLFEITEIFIENRKRQRKNLLLYSTVIFSIFSYFAYSSMNKIITLKDENEKLLNKLHSAINSDSITIIKRPVFIVKDSMINIKKPVFVENKVIITKPVYEESNEIHTIKKPIYAEIPDTAFVKKPIFVIKPDSFNIYRYGFNNHKLSVSWNGSLKDGKLISMTYQCEASYKYIDSLNEISSNIETLQKSSRAKIDVIKTIQDNRQSSSKRGKRMRLLWKSTSYYIRIKDNNNIDLNELKRNIDNMLHNKGIDIIIKYND